MQIPRWRNMLLLRHILSPPTTTSESTAPILKTHLASFHSTTIACQKRKSKWNSEFIVDARGDVQCCGFQDVRQYQEPSKNCIKFVTRQKRADTKRALNNLFNCGRCESPFQRQQRIWSFGKEVSNANVKKRKVKTSAPHSTKSHQKKRKGKFRRESFEDLEYAQKVFQAAFGNSWYTWSFNDPSFRGSAFEFESSEHAKWSNYSSEEWATSIESDSDDEECYVGSSSDRSVLGLPPTGPLKIEDVKKAFHLSALKWHPDKHQSPLQAMAEEKFKVCVNAYKSLCAALSSG